MDAKTRVVLCGDHKQLGPVLHTKVDTVKPELGTSLLERLMNRDAYWQTLENGQRILNPVACTKLLRNYRSHPAILDLPSQLFYDGELQACADVAERQAFCQWPGLAEQKFPVIF